ncbi:MAG: bifunctional DNA-binding transcriptional regulator/O6-methylguanine-DNA methyltransferase Ada [Acetobacteraceae bacterium]|nr:bifunctional DNA-binding transcriptional regulator/O6-methylguanine-DNA methyltransferase Ada [Acetobacteraceae bacterium]
MSASTQDPHWRAVAERDREADATLFYGVRTTGVYCRPSCPSRRPHPENTRFFASAGAAEEAGFRPCKRCVPDQSPHGDRQAATVAAACRAIEAAETTPPLDRLAAAAGLSPSHFHRLFRRATGTTPRAYARAHRAAKIRTALGESASVTEAIYGAGYGSSSRFYEASDGLLGMTPTAFRAGGAGTGIRFAVGACSLGAILVAESDRGVCAITLGDDPDALVRALQDRFPNATLAGGDPLFEARVALVVGCVEAPGLGTDLPLDIRGTAFQQRVWAALRQIPSGATASYGEVARLLGQPQAVRAVAAAVAANPLAVLIPCHRVIRTGGGLSGYRWGVDRKRALLAREAAPA